MKIVLTRIDNRLLHGIVATQWAPKVKCQRVMVIDDAIATDPIMKESMKLGRPINTAISIITKETAINNFQQNKYEGQNLMIIVKDPMTLVDLVAADVPIKAVNIGGTVPIEDGVRINKRAFAGTKELAAYNALVDQGIDVYSQYVPNDEKTPYVKQ